MSDRDAHVLESEWEGTLRAVFAEAGDREDAQSRLKPPPQRNIDAVFRTYRKRRRQRQRRAAFYFVLFLGVGLGTWFALDRGRHETPTSRSAADPSNALAYAESLFDRVLPRQPGGWRATNPTDLLQRDPEARAEYLRALDHPSGSVRRAAVQMLSYSRIPIEPQRLLRALSTWDETLDYPILVAEAGDTGRHAAAQLETLRADTVLFALEAIGAAVKNEGLEVDPAVIVPHLEDPDFMVRGEALYVLSLLEAWVPTAEESTRLLQDSSPLVRGDAASLLLERGGSAGETLVRELLADERELDVLISVWKRLQGRAGAERYARARLESGADPLGVRLQYARWLLAKGDGTWVETLTPLVLESGDASALYWLVRTAQEQQQDALRAPLLEAVERLDPPRRKSVQQVLDAWAKEAAARRARLGTGSGG
jgi:hypothetical protein